MATIGSLVIDLYANVAQLSRDMSRATKILGSFEGTVKNIGRTIIGAAGFGSMTVAVRSVVLAVEEAEKASFKLDAVLKATGFSAGVTRAQIDKLAESMARSTLFDDEAIRNASAVFATFRNIQGATFTEGIKLAADMSAVLGTDLQSSVTQLGKALNDPIAGITALSRAGVQFSAAQKSQIADLMKANDLLGAQKIILDRVAGSFGGAAGGAASGLAGAIHAVTHEWNELLETIGKRSIATDWIKDFAEGIRALHEALDPSTATMIANVDEKLEKLAKMKGMPGVDAAIVSLKAWREQLLNIESEDFLGAIADQDEVAAKAIVSQFNAIADAAIEAAEALRDIKAPALDSLISGDLGRMLSGSQLPSKQMETVNEFLDRMQQQMMDDFRKTLPVAAAGDRFFGRPGDDLINNENKARDKRIAAADAATGFKLPKAAEEFSNASGVAIAAFGAMAAAAISGSGQMSSAVIMAMTQIAQAVIQMKAAALGSMAGPLGAIVGAVGGILLAATARPSPVHVASVSPEAASQMNGPRETKPQYITLIFKDPNSGKVFEQFTVDANRATKRDAIDRVPANALAW